jgi:lipoprotein-releasing system permease protein
VSAPPRGSSGGVTRGATRGETERSSFGFSRPFPLLLALRYLRSTRRDAFISFLSATAAGGLALGSAALVLALAALGGFQQALKREVLARTPEIEIELPAGADVEAVRGLVARRSPAAVSHLEIAGPGWLLASGHARAVTLVGFEGRLPLSFRETPGREERDDAAGATESIGAWVPERLAVAWDLAPGAPIELVSGQPTLTPFGLQPRVARVPLAGTFAPGRTELEDRVALPLTDAGRLLAGTPYHLNVTTGSLNEALALAPRLAGDLPQGAVLRTWRELNRGLFFALKLEKSLMFLAIFLIVVVAALALVSDLHLLIASKRPEIGMLGAMGARPESLRSAFLLLGSLLAVGGVVAGTAVGVGGAWLLDRTRALRLPGQVYFLDYVPFVVLRSDLVAIVGTSLVLAAGCAFWAAGRATSLDPVQALRR